MRRMGTDAINQENIFIGNLKRCSLHAISVWKEPLFIQLKEK